MYLDLVIFHLIRLTTTDETTTTPKKRGRLPVCIPSPSLERGTKGFSLVEAVFQTVIRTSTRCRFKKASIIFVSNTLHLIPLHFEHVQT